MGMWYIYSLLHAQRSYMIQNLKRHQPLTHWLTHMMSTRSWCFKFPLNLSHFVFCILRFEQALNDKEGPPGQNFYGSGPLFNCNHRAGSGWRWMDNHLFIAFTTGHFSALAQFICVAPLQDPPRDTCALSSTLLDCLWRILSSLDSRELSIFDFPELSLSRLVMNIFTEKVKGISGKITMHSVCKLLANAC